MPEIDWRDLVYNIVFAYRTGSVDYLLEAAAECEDAVEKDSEGEHVEE